MAKRSRLGGVRNLLQRAFGWMFHGKPRGLPPMNHDSESFGEDMPYSGSDRRKRQRRVNPERRADIRWEPAGEPRRSGKERRKSSWSEKPVR